jgi:hypothetical protein
MPISRVTTWSPLDTLTAVALNGEFNQVMNNCVSLTGAETLTNKTLTAPVLSGTATGTYTLGGTPAVASPVLSGTVTGTYTLGGTPTLTAPTITAPKVTTGSFFDNGSGGASKTIDWAVANTQLLTLSSASCALTFSNLGNDEKVTFIVKQNAGSQVVVWPTDVRWLNGTGATNSTTDAPTLTTTASKLDVFTFYRCSALNLTFGTVAGFRGAIT